MDNQSNRLNKIFLNLELCKNSIYDSEFLNTDQKKEIEMRETVANVEYDDYLNAISQSHSIPVMDWEVKQTLHELPKEAIILDVGGCWGWHWREIQRERPDLKVIIVDFVRENLNHAKNLLGKSINNQIFLVHGDATQLPFPDSCFDLVWTVQTFQHIPDFKSAVNESHRVLIGGGGVYKLFIK